MTSSERTIGFLLLNHLHHIYHVAPIAFELSRLSGWIVKIYVSFPQALTVLERIRRHYPGERCEIRFIRQSLLRRLITYRRHPFPRPKLVLVNNAAELLSLDAVVSSDFYSNSLVAAAGPQRPRFIYSFHGAGDGEHAFRRDLLKYDLLLLSGENFRQRLAQEGILDQVDWQLVGYPKFDLLRDRPAAEPQLFAQSRPVVVYNPHFLESKSSWFRWGPEVLRFFFESERYNLIFAPHIMLFSKRNLRRLLPAAYFDCGHMHLDPGSERSVDMTYTRLADVYLADASSQVYEFLVNPRPCVFLNALGLAWRDDPNYRHWHLGEVVEDMDALPAALAVAPARHASFRDAQIAYLNDKFSVTDEPSAMRAARAIDAYVPGRRG